MRLAPYPSYRDPGLPWLGYNVAKALDFSSKLVILSLVNPPSLCPFGHAPLWRVFP